MSIECSEIIWIWHSFQGTRCSRCSMKAHWKSNQQCTPRYRCSLCSLLSLFLARSACEEFFCCPRSPNTRFVHQHPQICWSFVHWCHPCLQTWHCRASFFWGCHSRGLDRSRSSTSWRVGSRTISCCLRPVECRGCWQSRCLRRICCICRCCDRFFGDFYLLRTRFCRRHGTGW